MIPEIIPEKNGAPDANAMPRHKGMATKKTTIPEGKSLLIRAKRLLFIARYFRNEIIIAYPVETTGIEIERRY
jgi:hypothetical protein